MTRQLAKPPARSVLTTRGQDDGRWRPGRLRRGREGRPLWGGDGPLRALTAGVGRIRAGGVERDVAFEVPEPEVADGITGAYHAKYDRYGASIVGTVVSPEAARSTLRLVPR